jgi:L-ascorbate metabolism protein UlaG (beta-lactamase superfamily)
MIAARQKDSGLLADMLSPADEEGDPSLWWLGQSGFLLRWRRHYAVIDPYLSDSLTRKYADSARPHVRLTERCIDPSRLGFVTLAFSTHGHTDHFDGETLRAMAEAPNRTERLHVVLPAANLERARALFSGLDVELTGVTSGRELQEVGYAATVLPAAHPEIARDAAGNDLYLGFAVRVGRWTIYHSGDTLWREEVVRAAAAVRPDLALLPINGDDPSRGVAGNLNGEEAAQLAHAIGASVAIPHHYDMFAFNTAPPEPFVRRCRELGVYPRQLLCGERFDFGDLPLSPP